MKAVALASVWNLIVLAAVSVLHVHVRGTEVSVTPVQKVLELLESLLTQAKSGKHEEEIQYAAFKQFCDGATTQKQETIKEADNRIDSLNSHIQKYDTEAARLNGEIVGHKADIAGWHNDTKSAISIREQEHADYTVMHRNYTESQKAIDQAIAFLKKQAYDRPAATSLVQQQQQQAAAVIELLPKAAGNALAAFLERTSEDPDLTFVAPPEADAYEFRSHGVIDMLARLKDKFREKVTELEKEEISRKHAHQTLLQDLSASVKAGEDSAATKTKYEAKMKQNSADSSADLQDVTTTREDDNDALTELTTTCQQKAADFTNRQELRGEEITALSKAIALISGSSVAAIAEKHLPQDIPPPENAKKSLFVQLKSSSSAPSSSVQLKAKQGWAAALLLEASKRLGSQTLSAAAARAREDPFAKVKQLIQELIDRLTAQADEEAQHKDWCDKELTANEQTRTSKTKEVEGLMAEIDGTQTSIALLEKDLAELSAQLAQLNSDIAKETELRNTEKARNEETVKEAQDAQTTVAEALSVLREFYDKAATATSFAQEDKTKQLRQRPEIFEGPYQGLQSQKGGVLGMLEVIHSDFARLEQDTASAEAAAADEYDKFMDASTADKAQKEKDQKHKESDKQSQEADLLQMQSDLESAQEALDAAMATYDKLKPACLDTGTTYDQRVQHRQDEIESLQEALSILNGEDVVVHHGVLVKGESGEDQLRSDITGEVYK